MKRFLIVAIVILFTFGAVSMKCGCTPRVCACNVCVDGVCKTCQCKASCDCKRICSKCAKKLTEPARRISADEDNDTVWKYYYSSVRIKSLGSGTVIDSYKNDQGKYVNVVLTCYHILDKNLKSVTIELFWPTRQQFVGYILESQRENDVAIIIFESANSLPYTPLAVTTKLSENDRICSIGCPNLSEPVGHFATYLRADRSNFAFSRGSARYTAQIASTGGHSGGGMFKNGATIGVLVASGGNESEYVTTEVCQAIYVKYFQNKSPTCRRIFGRNRQDQYGGPPSTTPPPISLVPAKEEPIQEPAGIIEETPEEPAPDNTTEAILFTVMASSAGSMLTSWRRRTKIS